MLTDLGETADQVCNSLRTLGIRGVRNTVRFLNPVVRYAHTFHTHGVAIDLILGDRLRVDHGDGRVTVVDVPPAVREFLDRFHQGKYPDLELPVGPDGTVVPYLKFVPHGVKPAEVRREQSAER